MTDLSSSGARTTAETSRELYRQWLDEVWGGQPGAAARFVSPDFVGHWPGREVHGPDALEAIVEQTRGMFDDISFQLQVGPLVEGNLVAARWTGRGTTRKGEVVNFLGNDLLRVRDGRFVEYWPASPADR